MCERVVMHGVLLQVYICLSHPTQVLAAVREVTEEVKSLSRRLFSTTQSTVRGSDYRIHSLSQAVPQHIGHWPLGQRELLVE